MINSEDILYRQISYENMEQRRNRIGGASSPLSDIYINMMTREELMDFFRHYKERLGKRKKKK